LDSLLVKSLHTSSKNLEIRNHESKRMYPLRSASWLSKMELAFIAGVDQKTAGQLVDGAVPTPSVPTRMRSRAMSMFKSPSRFGKTTKSKYMEEMC
jgi:hypothetical protein